MSLLGAAQTATPPRSGAERGGVAAARYVTSGPYAPRSRPAGRLPPRTPQPRCRAQHCMGQLMDVSYPRPHLWAHWGFRGAAATAPDGNLSALAGTSLPYAIGRTSCATRT